MATNYCPFLSGPYSHYKRATTTTNTLPANMAEEYIADMVYISCIKTNCALWNANKGRCYMINDSAASQPAAMMLVNEFMSKQDQDRKDIPGVGTGAIYGKDFMIIEDDNIPPMLKGIHKNPDFNEPAIKITWQAYLNL